ncbi:MAG TPA: YicC/YloC family endoribonuclease [Myxococcaceae bacterium]|nr:YicC/YloC family endoribonuclease [Myxococcaceae bacterium]
MTGFGVGRGRAGDEELTAELKAVNHKYLEVKVRLPRELQTLEPELQRQVRGACTRGAVELSLRRTTPTSTGSVPTVDAELARAWRSALAEVARATGLPDQVTAAEVAAQTGVVRMEEPTVDAAAAARAADLAVAEALAGLQAMREREGAALERDLRARLLRVEQLVRALAALAPRAVEEYRDRLAARLADLTGGTGVEPARLAQELALFAERTDIAEELTRLDSHLGQFRTLLVSAEPAGRRLDFLLQEMNREVNTAGSKIQSGEASVRVVELKAELERIREQVQNVE